MTDVLSTLQSLPAPVVYLAVGVLVFGESALFVGFVLPGETAVVGGGILAAVGRLDIAVLMTVVVAAAVLGDAIGFEVGRRYGAAVLRWRILRRYQVPLARARALLRRHGAAAVLIGRWTAFLRAVTPGLAGLSRMGYPTFLVANVVGAVIWGVTVSLGGYLAGHYYETVLDEFGTVWAAVLILAAITLAIAWRWRRSRKDRGRRVGGMEDGEPPSPPAAVPGPSTSGSSGFGAGGEASSPGSTRPAAT
ncbi:MAG TPA: DedA family protein [Kineosporiaceae bacterium]